MKTMCLFELMVQIPGRPPYEVTIRQAFLPFLLYSELQPGTTVAVEVDSSNPQNVRIVPVPTQRPPQTQSPIRPPTVAEQANAYQQNPGAVPTLSLADILASGQRVRGVLKSFADTGTTARSVGITTSRPELLDAPRYMLEVQLHFPNLAPVTGRAVQPVPQDQVPALAVGRELTCAVDPGNLPHRFAVDWDDGAH
jgi:hypothetical protein